jgi:hypothetical protein
LSLLMLGKDVPRQEVDMVGICDYKIVNWIASIQDRLPNY